MKQDKILLHCMVAADPNFAEADHDRLTEQNLQILQYQTQPCEDLAGIIDVPRRQVKMEERIEKWLEGIGANTATGGNYNPTSAQSKILPSLADNHQPLLTSEDSNLSVTSSSSSTSTSPSCSSFVPDCASSIVSKEASSFTDQT